MEKTFETRIKQKRDTDENWAQKNPILLDGELIFVDTADGQLKAKVGDGVKSYIQLSFCDAALKAFIAETYITLAQLQEALSALNLGFAATEEDM